MIEQPKKSLTCLVLYSGGLDSILACKVLQKQGIHVLALRFITPFFGYGLKGQEEAFKEEALVDYGIKSEVIDISERYLKMLKNPKYGYGRHINPCIDCKILMVQEALKRLEEFGASFIATGEVLGQRPMSQRRDSLRIIERDSGAEGLLLRPLSALHFPPADIEKRGIVDRSRLLSLSGRGRKDQMALVARYGIERYPAPAGGCVLTDPIISQRLKSIFGVWPNLGINDCLLAQLGRHFLLPDRSWLVIGRKERENAKLISLMTKGDVQLNMLSVPGPTGLWRKADSDTYAPLAAGILCRYTKMRSQAADVELSCLSTEKRRIVRSLLPSDKDIERLKIKAGQ
ncbi:MAG: thiamine biosynthesis protein [Nitrospiraceae bacterium]|nr:thiamine biosynthesis protein [Nitrospiraceae bacterium]